MSSTYGLLCLNHDPAIPVGEQSECYEPEPMLHAAGGRGTSKYALPSHSGCDLLVGRYCWPLVAVACPGGHKAGRGATCGHTEPAWISTEQLRLLAYAYRGGLTGCPTALERVERQCWTRTRVLRLAPLLGLDLGENGSKDAIAARTFEAAVG